MANPIKSGNNVQNIKFLRNASIASTRDAAVALFDNNKSLAEDGTAMLARYQSGNDIKTLVGFVAESGGTKYVTIIDVEGASGDVNTLREEINNKLGTGITSSNTATQQLKALSGSSSDTSGVTSVAGAKKYAENLIETLDKADTAVEGSYVSQVSQTDGIISVSRVALPDASSVANENKVVSDVTQSKGKITATAKNITDVKIGGYVEGADTSTKVAATDSLGTALGKLQGQINGMDKAANVVAGQVVTTVSETDGKVEETKANVKDLQLGGYSKTTSTGAIASTDTINVALSKLENKAAAITIANADKSINVTTAATGTDINVNIKSGEHVLAKDGNAGIYTNLKLNKITTELPAEIKERYQLIATDDSQIGSNIDIYKDSSIVSITYITDPSDAHYQNLKYEYIDVSGNTKTEYVDISSLVLEAEFASGITVTNHIAHGVVDSASEKDGQGTPQPFLTVGASGFKISGIGNEIKRQINLLDVSAITPGDGKYISSISETDGKISATGSNVSDAVLNGYAKGTKPASTAIAATDPLKTALAKLEHQVDDAVARADAASTVIASGTSADTTEHLEIVKTTNSTTSADTYTFNLKNIASQTDLDTLSGKTFTVATSSNASITTAVTDASDGTKKVDLITDASKIKMSGFTAAESGFTEITEATTVTGAVKAIETVVIDNERVTASALNNLNDKINTLSGETVSAVKVNNVALAETDNAVNIQIASASHAIVVTTDQSTGAVDLGIQILDCGTY